MKPRLETMPERIERIMYEYGEAGAKKPAHYDNKNIITYENKGVPPKKFDAMDKSTYPSDRDQYQRLIQKDPQMKNTMTSNEIVLAEFTPKDIKAMDPKDRKLKTKKSSDFFLRHFEINSPNRARSEICEQNITNTEPNLLCSDNL